jgi:hypothetical protein
MCELRAKYRRHSVKPVSAHIRNRRWKPVRRGSGMKLVGYEIQVADETDEALQCVTVCQGKVVCRWLPKSQLVICEHIRRRAAVLALGAALLVSGCLHSSALTVQPVNYDPFEARAGHDERWDQNNARWMREGDQPLSRMTPMKRRYELVILAAVSLATTACANRVWYNPDVSPEQARRDTAECQMRAIAGGGLALDMSSAMLSGMRQAEINSLCFQSKSYYLVEKQD